MSNNPFTVPNAAPFYPEYPLFMVGAFARQWEFNGWKPESLSWKHGCYIHAGLSGPGQVLFRGPDTEAFLSSIFVNNFSRFKVGAAKHAVACDDRGLIVGHGVLQRLAADEFRLFVGGTWPSYQLGLSSYDVEQEIQNNYLFQIAGPNAQKIIEAASGEDLGDVKFLRFRNISVAGHTAEIMRIGMAGTLAYELHGPIAEGPAVYQAIVDLGAQFGLERLGWKTYTVNHAEGGFPQQIWTFLPATHDIADFRAFESAGGSAQYRIGSEPLFAGSVDPANLRARYRTPQEVGWQRSVQFDHDFIGREALEREAANPRRTIVTLVWDSDDVIDVYASLFRSGEEYKYIELPSAPHLRGPLAYADHVVKGGRDVGVSSGVAYSYFYRQMISHATIDIEQAVIGNEVVVKWGDHNGKIKDIRAHVERFPYLTEGSNR